MQMNANQQRLVTENMKLVHFVIAKNYPKYIYDTDIVSVGYLGLCRAVTTWDESKSKFSTYAVKCIRNEIRGEFKSRSRNYVPLSLDSNIKNDSDDELRLGDCVAGDKDVEYVDSDEFCAVLSPREQEVFRLRQKGMGNRSIAKEIGIAQHSVSVYLGKIKRKWDKFYGID